MRKPVSGRINVDFDIEGALARLMPVGLSQGAETEIGKMIDELEVGSHLFPTARRFTSHWPAAVGIAAAVVVGGFLTIFALVSDQNPPGDAPVASSEAGREEPEMVFLAESDRVEDVSDEGLFIDASGSATRKLRVRLIGESRIRDEETGIVVMLTEPREEMYMMPVSTF